MNLKHLWAIVLRQIYLYRSSYTRTLSLFVWITVDVFLWGFITKYLNIINNRKTDFVILFLGAVLLWDFLARVMYGIITAFFEDIWSRNFMNLFVTPIRLREYISGLIISSILTSSLALLLMLAIAITIFKLPVFLYGTPLILYFFVLLLFGIALGIFAISVVLRFGPSVEWVIWTIPAIISPFVGVFYPVKILPQWMQKVSAILPPTYIFESMRTIIHYSHNDTKSLLTGATLCFFYLALAYILFRKTFSFCVKNGQIVKFSAENLS
ncbi:MAG: ABC transporter permease [candidate division WOR-3 bacterium]